MHNELMLQVSQETLFLKIVIALSLLDSDYVDEKCFVITFIVIPSTCLNIVAIRGQFASILGNNLLN